MSGSIRLACVMAVAALGCRQGAAASSAVDAAASRELVAALEARIARITADLRPSPNAPPVTLDERMRRLETPGVSIAVIDDFALHWARGFGAREAGSDEAVDASTVFQAAAISQPVFALAVLRMVEAGRIDLDADVNASLRSWKIPAVDGWQPRITLRHLLTHSAALSVEGYTGYRRGEPLPTLSQILDGEAPANSSEVRVVGLPGLAPRYSSGGALVAQLLVSDTLNQPFASVMRDWLLAPLEMDQSTYAQPLPEDGRLAPAAGHALGGEVLTGKYRVYPEAAAAGLWTTPSDLAKVMLAMMHAASGREDGPLPAEWVKEMLTPQTAPHMGIGFFLSSQGETKRFGHGGSNVGYRAELVGYERLGKGAVVMINSQAEDLVAEILEAVAREYGWPDFAPAPREAVQLPARALRKLPGVYRTSAGAVLTFRVSAGVLELEAAGQPALQLTPLSPTEFRATAQELDVRFHLAPNGRVQGVSIDQPGTPSVSAKPQP